MTGAAIGTEKTYPRRVNSPDRRKILSFNSECDTDGCTLVWLKNLFLFWPRRCHLEDQKTAGGVRLSLFTFRKGGRLAPPTFTRKKRRKTNVREPNPQKSTPQSPNISF